MLRVIPPREDETAEGLEVRWSRAVALARSPAEGEAELHLPLRAVAVEPVGYLRLLAEGRRLRLQFVDLDALRELCAAMTHQIERAAIQNALDLRLVNEAKDRFLAGINHEIRNPLNGLTGLLEILKTEKLGGRSAHLLETMSACAAQLAATMDNALDFASLSQGPAGRREARFELGELVRGGGAHDFRSADRVRHVLPAGPVWLRGDAGKLRQILGNLVGNALKYGQPPHAEVSAVLLPRGGERMELTLEVANPSPPESTRDMEEWFQPFRRGRRALDTGVPGTGLGLAICQRLVEAMDGTINARRRGPDVVFTVTVIVSRSQPPEEGQTRLRAMADAAEASVVEPRGRVLAIEDESYNRLVLNHYLGGWGYEVEWAESGATAESRMREGPFDLIVMDWRLDDADGSTLLPRLRALAPGGRLPPVIVLSAYATEEKQAAALAAGARAFLTKPLDPAALREILARHLPKTAHFHLGAAATASSPEQGPAEDGPRIDTAALLADLKADFAEARTLAGRDAPKAALCVHTMRGRARLLPPSELNDALADLERALAGPAVAPPVLSAAFSAVDILLREQKD
jgi:signal transduction histidine kinase/CheY-like chemotaxis protein